MCKEFAMLLGFSVEQKRKCAIDFRTEVLLTKMMV